MYTTANELPCIMGVKELTAYLGISRAGVYNLMHREDFPTLRVNSRLLVTRDNLLSWMERNTNCCESAETDM